MLRSRSCRRRRLQSHGVPLPRRVLQCQIQSLLGQAMKKVGAHDAGVRDRKTFRRGIEIFRPIKRWGYS